MTNTDRIEKQKALIEEFGRYFDKEGLQPIAGRILGLLMVSDKEQFTFDEIVSELQISKSSASNAIKILELRGDIEYSTIPGDRKRYFHIKRQDSLALIDVIDKKLSHFKNGLEKILSFKSDQNTANAIFYNEVISVLEGSLECNKALKERFSKSKSQKQ